MKLLAAILALAACGHHDEDLRPCTKPTAHLEIVRVDDNSTYMKNVYKHVGSDQRGQPTEPGAIAAGITADVDSWKGTETKAGMELGERHVDFYLVGHDRDALEKYLATLDPVPTDRKLVLEHVMPRPEAKDRRAYWRTYYVMTTDIIDETEIASAKTVEPDGDRVYRPSASVKLTPAGQAAFAEATAKTVGHKIATIVDGDVIIVPVINMAIRGGSFIISMDSTSDVEKLLKRLGC
jgi:preprotein translocase subunit SecD